MSDEVPFDEDDADRGFKLANAGPRDGKTVAQVKEENTFAPVPRGKNDFVINSVKITSVTTEGVPELKVHEVFTANGETGVFDQLEGYESYDVQVIYGLASDPRVTVRERLVLPPPNTDEWDLYMYGAKGRTDAQGNYTDNPEGRKIGKGSDWNRIRAIVVALGHGDGEEGQLPDSALDLRDWKYWPDDSIRSINLDIGNQQKVDDATGKWVDSLDKDGKPYPNIKWLSYERTHDTLVKLGLASADDAPKKAPEPRPKQPTKAELGAKSNAINRPPAAPARPAAPAPPSRPAPPATKPAAPSGVKPPVAPPARPAAPAAPGKPAAPVRKTF